MGCLDDQAHGHRVSFRNNVLLGCMQVGESADDRTDQRSDLLAPLDGPQCAPVELHCGCQVVGRLICLVLVKRRFDEGANNLLVFLNGVLSSHFAL